MAMKKRIKKKEPGFTVAEEEKVKKPHHVPIDVYIQEAKNLFHWASEDREGLIAAGLAPGIIEDLPNRCEALSQAETLWYVERNTRRDAVKKCAELSSQANELKRRILKNFTFGFRDKPGLLKKIRNIRREKKKVETVHSLHVLYNVGKNNSQLLTAFGFDMSWLDQAVQTANALEAADGKAGNCSVKYSDAKINRDRAYTDLKKAIDKIRVYGRFVFRDNKERFRGYSSNHMREQNARKVLKAKNAAAEKKETTEVTEVTDAANGRK